VAVTRPLAMARLNVRWSKAVPVIAIPLAFRSAAACAVEATNGLAVQSLTWISPHHGSIFCWGKNRNRAAADFKILGELKSKSDARISAGVGKIDANNWFLSMTWGKGTDHLPIS